MKQSLKGLVSMEHYKQIERKDWQLLEAEEPVLLDEKELGDLTSLNDRVRLADVREIYIPLIKLFDVYFKHHQVKQAKVHQFLNESQRRVPFIIGISGSVSVGKSTTARLIQTLLQRVYPDKKVELMTTDGFLLANAELENRGIADKKGFPESYDMEKLVSFLWQVKTSDEPAYAPVYSHDIYDIVPDTFQQIDNVDVLIVEGINVLQLPPNREIYVSDFFDWRLFVDADAKDIEQWFIERFEMLLDLAKDKPDNFYYPYAIGDRQEAVAMARRVWKETNLKNLTEYILPTKSRADVILHKGKDHLIDYVLLKKY